MRTQNVIILAITGLLILAGVAVYADAIARPELTTGVRLVVTTGSLGLTLAVVIIVVTWGWIGYERSRLAREQRLEAAARRKQAERDAALTITVAPPGHQIIAHKTGTNMYHDPLHLIPGRVNGVASEPTPEEIRRWTLHQIVHSTGREIPLPIAAPGTPALLTGQVELPSLVRLVDLLPGVRGNMNNLVLGVKINAAGQLERVTISLHELFHTIVAASSGWGKSAFASSILAQLATCADPVELVLIDQQEHGLASFKNCDRLRYPLLRQPGEILSALREIYKEATRCRTELFTRCDADNLDEYNRMAACPLPPIIVAVDEASALLASDKEIAAELKRQAWELRKFGIYQILLLTLAKGTTIDTDHRQQFSSKVQLHANDKYQARLLMDAIEATNFPAGRAVIELPKQQPAVVQTPYIDKREVRSLLRPASEPPAAPAVAPPEPNNLEGRVLELYSKGGSRSAIARKVFDSDGGNQLKRVDLILEKFRSVIP